MSLVDWLSGAAASVLTLSDDLTLGSFNLLLQNGATSMAVGPLVKVMGGVLKTELAKGDEDSKRKIADLSRIGTTALNIAYENNNDSVAKDLATAALDLLLDAIKMGNKRMVESLSETFVKGLLTPRENLKYKAKVDGLVDERRVMFNEALVHEKNGTRPAGDNPPTADDLAQAATALLVAAVDLQIKAEDKTESNRYRKMVHYFSTSWVTALELGIQDGCESRVRGLVGDRTSAFSEAMKEEWETGEDKEAEILSEAGVEVLLRTVEQGEQGKRDLVEIFSESWVEALERAINDKRDLKARVEAMVSRRTAAFVKALGQGGEDSTTLSGAGVAVLLAAIERGNVKLILSLSRSWVEALNAKGVVYDQVAPLIEQRTEEFRKAITSRDVKRAKILSKAGIAVLLAAVEEKACDLVGGLSKSWVQALGRTIAQFETDATTRDKEAEKADIAKRDEVIAEAVNFGKKLVEGVERSALEGCRAAMLKSAADLGYKEVADLVDENWKKVFPN